jgi:hypothetical protein
MGKEEPLLGNNIKVHFAGTEQIDHALVIHKVPVYYYLFTVFPFIAPRIGIKPFPILVKKLFVPKELEKIAKHLIMDSGLFTLMFGSHAGNRDKAFLDNYFALLIDFIQTNKLSCTCVEIDCQKVLGIDAAWEYRYKMRDMLQNKQINVFHIEDGQKGLDRLIEFSDYIAVSVPEIRLVKQNHKEAVYQLACYIKNKKPGIDIHLLGCTEAELLKRCRFCTSSDSTSWQQPNRYGHIGNYHVSSIKTERLDEAVDAVRSMFNYCGITETQYRLKYYSYFYVSGLVHKRKYESIAGNQD